MKLKMAEAARRRPRKLLPHLVGETGKLIRPESVGVKDEIRTHGPGSSQKVDLSGFSVSNPQKKP